MDSLCPGKLYKNKWFRKVESRGTIQKQHFIFIIISSDLDEFRQITNNLGSQDCFVVEVHSDNSTCLSDIKRLAFLSHHLVKIIHRLSLEISLKNKGKARCKLFVSDSSDNIRKMAEEQIKANEEHYYSFVLPDLKPSLNKICLSSDGITRLITELSNCSQSKPANIIKIPVIFIPYQPYIGEGL